jgi:hypothetical protein
MNEYSKHVSLLLACSSIIHLSYPYEKRKKNNLETTTSKGNYQTLIVMKITKPDHKKASSST